VRCAEEMRRDGERVCVEGLESRWKTSRCRRGLGEGSQERSEGNAGTRGQVDWRGSQNEVLAEGDIGAVDVKR